MRRQRVGWCKLPGACTRSTTLLTAPPSFLHGGAWRDPSVTSTVADPLFSHVLNTHPPLALNAASINYRLSPHPDCPANTATHPDHIDDVLAALAHLERTRGMRDYILVGHSAGATLAFQALAALQQRAGAALPQAVYGVEGIYDVRALIAEYPEYREFVAGAFGADDARWPPPLDIDGYRGLVVLAQSDDDGLLSWRQTEEMKERCELALGVGGGIRVVKLAGQHDAVLESDRLAGIVERYVRELR